MALEQTLQPTTALEAINDMLASIGQGAVNTLEENESVDAQSAIAFLVNASREIQERGWFFNTDYDFVLAPDANGEIKLASNCLQFEPDYEYRGRYVERGRKLYDREEQTNVFPSGTEIKGRLVWFLPFEDLPQAARTYIHRAAGRAFQESMVGSDLAYRFTREREEEALAALTRADLRADRPNAIQDNPATFYTAAGFRRRR